MTATSRQEMIVPMKHSKDRLWLLWLRQHLVDSTGRAAPIGSTTSNNSIIISFSLLIWQSNLQKSYLKKRFFPNHSNWKCLNNQPNVNNNATVVQSAIQYSYSLDEQCRMEFGEGYDV